MKVIDYIVLSGDSAYNISKTVAEFIKEGWQPLGPAMPDKDNSGYTRIFQTMVKYSEDK